MTSQLTEIALQMLGTIERMELIIPEITDTIRKALEEKAMTTDFRALCAELADELHGYASANPHHDSDDLVARARAALAEPVPVGPTDEDLVELACAEVYNSRNWEEPECTTDDPYPYEASSFAWLNFARAVLARWGNQS
jgi:hypothetical protein